ncbi:hypothetical protein K1719_043774 [Acacia pycnantha]|nr:hypothetical protein K1719_043774 [Acacia pycnantha]
MRNDEVVESPEHHPIGVTRVDKRTREKTAQESQRNEELLKPPVGQTTMETYGPFLECNQEVDVGPIGHQPTQNDPGSTLNEAFDSGQLSCGPALASPCLDEPIMDEQDGSRLGVLKQFGYDSVRIIPSSGRSGGLALAWSSSATSLTVVEENRQFFHFHCQRPNVPPFLITAIYATPHSKLRSVLWEDLSRLSRGIQFPWAVLGDFNDILNVNERSGGKTGNFSRLQGFKDRLSNCGLNDIGSSGPWMTWRGPRLPGCARLYERLDRALSNNSFLQVLPDSYLKICARFVEGTSPSCSLSQDFQKPVRPATIVLKTWSLFVQTGSDLIGNPASIVEQSWQAPPATWIKINVDGAVSSSKSGAACGGVFRDHKGKWLAGFSAYLHN